MPLLLLASYVDDPARRGLIHLTRAQLQRNYSISTPDYERFQIHKQFGLDSCPSTVERAKGIKALKLRDPIDRTKNETERLSAKARRHEKRHAPRFVAPEKPVVDLITKVKTSTPVIPPDMTEMESQEYDPYPPEKPKAKKPAKPATKKQPAAKGKKPDLTKKATKPKIGRSNC